MLGNIQFTLTHSYRVVSDGAHDWHVSTFAYEYRLSDAADELTAWH